MIVLNTRVRTLFALVVVLTLLPATPGFAWGENGHKAVARYAILFTPEPLRSMLSAHAGELEEASVDPDRRKSDPNFSQEPRRHFIDLDTFDVYPFSHFPHAMGEAERAYGQQKLQSQGIAPWAIAESFDRLNQAWHDGDPDWLRWAGDLSHYVADIHQPFHTTANFDGQKTHNRGIHALFETIMFDTFWKDAYLEEHRCPVWLPLSVGALLGGVAGFVAGGEAGGLFGALAGLATGYELNRLLGPTLSPVRDPQEAAFTILTDSYTQIAPLLRAHDKAQRYSPVTPQFYQTFWEQGAKRVMVRQINKAAYDLARYWTGAWLAAGQPEF